MGAICMNIDEYERTGRRRYEQLAYVVASILEATVDSIPGLKKQQVQHRAKDPSSLRKKLEARGALQSADITKDAKDLAGCRVIFYTNSDVRTFEHSEAIWNNFEVDWKRTKFHYPLEEDDEAFVSKNYLVSLKEPRASLPEYAHLKGLWCEVQVQTTLDHSWSEMSHDIIYKPPEPGFGTQELVSIKKRLRKVMKEHLQPAGFDFQKISNDMSRLDKGRELFKSDLLEGIIRSNDNNEIYRMIGEYKSYVLPFLDDIDSEASLVRSALRDAVTKTKGTPETPFTEHRFGFLGHSGDDIFREALDLAEDICFSGKNPIQDTFDLLMDWHDESLQDEQKAQILKVLENISKYNLHVWKHAGASVQIQLIECLEKRLLKVTSVDTPTITIIREMLSTELSGTTSSAYDVTLHQGAVVFYEGLAQVRDKSIKILTEMYHRCETTEQFNSVINALTNCTRLPYRGKISPELAEMVLEDSIDFIKFCLTEANNFTPSVLESVEHRVFYMKRKWVGEIKTDWFTPQVAAVRDELIQLIENFKDIINANEDFVTFKALVGFEGISAKDWERGEINLEERGEETNSEIEKLVAEINDQNLDKWKSRIRACCAIKSEDLATFMNFAKFLRSLAQTKPDIAIDILNTEGPEVLAFCYNLLTGLSASSKLEEAFKIINSWLDKGQNLQQISGFFTTLTVYDGKLFEKCLKRAIEENNTNAVALMVDVGIKFLPENPEALKQLLLPAIRHLNMVDSRYWVNRSWGNLRSGEIVGKFSPEEVGELLDGMIKISKISYPEEWVLAGFAVHWPDRVLEFFIKRLEYEDAESPEDYEPIPFSFHQLNNGASLTPDLIVNVIRNRFPIEGAFFQFRTARLIHNFFPDLNVLGPVLNKLISTKEDQDLRIAAEILAAYDGQPEVFLIAKEIAAVADPESNAWKKLDFSLDATGVVAGHFGFVEAYKAKKSLILPWLDDARPNVKKYAEDYIKSLDMQISSEQRRSMEDKHLRERHYDSILTTEEDN